MAEPRTLRRLLCTLACFALLAGACGDSDDEDGAEPSGTSEAAPSTASDGSDTTVASTTAPDNTDAPTTESPGTTAPDETTAPDTSADDSTTSADTTSADTTTQTGDTEPNNAAELDFSTVDAFANGVIADAELDGASLIVVHRDDGVIHQAEYGTFEPGRVSMVASSSKMISAGVLMHLDQEGLLDLEEPVVNQTPWTDGRDDVTPLQLVSNSSGLVGLGPDPAYAPYLCQWTPDSSLQDCAETVLETEDDDADVQPPETEFRYGGAQWQVAGGVAETVSGKTWDELINEIYIEPCGVDSLGYLNPIQVGAGFTGYPDAFGGDASVHDATANPSLEGGAYISPQDYATLLLMHLQGGECPNGQVFTQESLDRMHTDRLAEIDLSAGAETGYGMGWWVDRETGIISDGGAWGSLPWLNLDAGYGAYWLIEDLSGTTGAISDELIGLVHQAVTGEELGV